MPLLKSIKEKFEHSKLTPKSHAALEPSIPSTSSEIDQKTIYRYRYNYGVNLGSLFVLEPWIYNTMFEEGGNDEFHAISNYMQKHSVNEAIAKLSEHYNAYISKIDWNWLRTQANVTALRVPIGYWHVKNGDFLSHLPFEPLRKVYEGAKPWEFLRELVKTAQSYNIGILIDVHGLPGGANTDAHSGIQNPKPTFFQESKYVSTMTDEILPFIVQDICSNYVNIIGLQIINESVFNNNAKGQKKYYSKAISSIREIDSTLPIVISDGWWPDQWADWLVQNKLDSAVVVDSHIYRCFSEDDKSKHAGQIIEGLPQSVNFPYDKADYMVGEFSCVLDNATWNKTQGDRNVHIHDFGNAETKIFSQVSSWGWFFWTLQFQYGDGGEWGFVPMMEKGNLLKRRNIPVNIPKEKVDNIISEHVEYWKKNGGENFEHWRYEDGIKTAIADIQMFDKFDCSSLGRWHSWMVQRREQYIKLKNDSEYMWEWEQGFQRGLKEFNKN
ncbi:hypothetical protein KAFR_0C00510 [Kazachstania africana CBS 2517]|uniref:Glycoside hydrolase family 5 domain-containing protein n=1 Tax=Kazachstania africana (strain ATCC 22294 / BCRC 22015 / CBS 2517 / CECT 1963 / NBRC 1671 / NRRL Y-8276) TaxID=1071382 RepID=H2ARP6_KAZAF|nr:hypothetical protein KAFR_0C00510 [Kazachstania africana CBS 2517]CCF57046.1 hypothetical protein KAFR_0C00510 [Kazachstania africana CBS 2517]